MNDLPELPVPANEAAPWTTEEAQAYAISYARKAVAAERERCARLVDALLAEYENNGDDNGWWFRDKAEACAAAVRGAK